jgi:lipopolysaccharide export system protein LptC
MTEYYYEDEVEEAPPPPPARRIRFDPTRERGADHFVRAERHSRLVRLLRIGLPAAAAAAVVGFVLIVRFAPDDTDAAADAAVISLAGVNIESKSLVMEKPNISGFEGTRHAYEVTAAKAIQDLNNPKVFTLLDINARVGVGTDDTAVIEATKGIYDSTTKSLVLEDGITIETTSGRKATFEDARVDLAAGDLASDRPVTISGSEGTIKANSIRVVDRGKRITFGGGVHLVVNPTEDDPFTPGDAQTAPPKAKVKAKAKPGGDAPAVPEALAAPPAASPAPATATAAAPEPLPEPAPGTVPAADSAPGTAPATAAVPPLPKTRPAADGA